ncbi:MAG TPA: glycosyltransferase [Bryobacteraceae bacterium]|nr:glycosyltransferase [Bryobacteraceae bacterium]
MKCSVLLPVYNAGQPLSEAIESILAQDESDFEFLIIEDCSRDGSAEIIRRFSEADSRIRAIFHRQNVGLAATLNEGLSEARCEFVARMDQDDAAMPNRLSTQIVFLRSRPQIAVAGSFVYHMGRTPEWDRLVRLPVDHEEIASTLPKSNCLYHPSVMLRRDLILALGGYRAEFHNSEDYDLWLRTSRAYRLANIPVPLLRYRFSATGMTLGRKWEQALYAQMAIVSYRHPGWGLEEVRRQAGLELNATGKHKFLLGVARGTADELMHLGQEEDARLAWWLFFRQLGWRQKIRLAATSGTMPFRRGARSS